MINTSSFGSIVIDGKSYSSDLIIFPDGYVKDRWRRRLGHRLFIEDIQELIDSSPEMIICGTGVSGQMKPDKEVKIYLDDMGIDFVPAPNREAIILYNEMITKKRSGACFHLTC